jgi:hypothetical protein
MCAASDAVDRAWGRLLNEVSRGLGWIRDIAWLSYRVSSSWMAPRENAGCDQAPGCGRKAF